MLLGFFPPLIPHQFITNYNLILIKELHDTSFQTWEHYLFFVSPKIAAADIPHNLYFVFSWLYLAIYIYIS